MEAKIIELLRARPMEDGMMYERLSGPNPDWTAGFVAFLRTLSAMKRAGIVTVKNVGWNTYVWKLA